MGGSELFAGLLDGRRVTNAESWGAIVGAVTGGRAFSAVLAADGVVLAGNGVMLARREERETIRGDSGEVKICAGGEVFGLPVVVANVLLPSRELSSTDGNSIAKVFLSLHRPARAIRVPGPARRRPMTLHVR